MKVLELVNILKNEKIRLVLKGERFICQLPDGNYRLSAELRQKIRNHHGELIQFLQGIKKASTHNPKSCETDADETISGETTSQPTAHVPSDKQDRLSFFEQLEQQLDYTYINDESVNPALLGHGTAVVAARH